MAPRRETRPREAARKPPLVAALERPEAYDHPVEPIRLAETHISWVFLTGEYAYKIKKPVKLPFLDFSTLERRKRFCEEELRLNRRLAPRLYLEVVPIGGTADAPRVGAEPAIEYAVKMRQFADRLRLDRQIEAGAVSRDALEAFAARLAGFHAELAPLQPVNASASALAAARDNFVALEPNLAAAQRRQLDLVRDWTERTAADTARAIDRRASLGRYRECHGDLHLENLLVEDGEIVAYDALEFDRELREIDVLSESGFLAMDLAAHGRSDLAYEFLNRYLEAGGDYDGLDVLRFYLVYRALVRAKVRAIKAAQSSAEAGRSSVDPYLELAAGLAAPPRPRLVITHGLSGSGKTYVTDRLIGPLAALRIRSDLERKRLYGLDSLARTGSAVGAGLYGPEATARTYERLAEIAATALAHGFSAIVDATFLRRAERERFRAVAGHAQAGFAMLDCSAPEAVLRSRIASRAVEGSDASEANFAVLDRQIADQEPLGADERHDAVAVATDALDVEGVLAELRARADSR